MRQFVPKPIYLDHDANFEGHGAAVLLLIRDRKARDWKSLCRAFHFDPDEFHSGHLALRSTIEELVEAGLVRNRGKWQGPYQLTEECHSIQHALGISLVQAANLTYFGGLAVQPFFGKPQLRPIAPHVFVLMPFSTNLVPIFRDSIKKACRKLGVSVARADDIFSASSVIADVWAAIYNAGVIVADCTSRNPNVFYEIGISHTLGKPVVLLAQRDEDVPFDIHYIRYIQYDQSEAGVRRIERALTKTLREVGTPVWTA